MSAERTVSSESQTAEILRYTLNHIKNSWNDENAGIVAATIQDSDASVTATSRYLPELKKWQHAEASALKKFSEEFKRKPEPSSLTVITLSPCVVYSPLREGNSCSMRLKDAGLNKIRFGYLDPWQVTDMSAYKQMGFDAALVPDENLQQTCRSFFKLFEDLYGPDGKFTRFKSLTNPWAEIKQLINPDLI